MKKLSKTIATLLMSTLITTCTVNGVYAFAQEGSVQQLIQENESLKAENKRLHNMISQYTIAVRGLNSEVGKIKSNLEENSIGNTEMIIDEKENKEYIGEYILTFYCTEPWCKICGGGGHTASGTIVTPGRSVAVDPSVIPLGTKLYIDGFGYRVAEDTGGAVKSNKIDINVETHEEALQLGKRKNVKVWIVED